jgi:hypothetical protein
MADYKLIIPIIASKRTRDEFLRIGVTKRKQRVSYSVGSSDRFTRAGRRLVSPETIFSIGLAVLIGN